MEHMSMRAPLPEEKAFLLYFEGSGQGTGSRNLRDAQVPIGNGVLYTFSHL